MIVRSFVLASVVLGGCRVGTLVPPKTPEATRRDAAHDTSSVDAPRADAMHGLLAAARAHDGADIASRMSPRLRRELPIDSLNKALTDLHTRFAGPLGILEEHVHLEGSLRWYSALVLHGQAEGGGVLTPVLYQFALDEDGALDHLVLREHWFIENVEHPAEAYLPVTRFHLPAKDTWYVMHGGRARATNYHHGNTHQRWAYDMVIKRDRRQRPRGSDKHDNASFYAHGEDLLAPAAGTVVHIVDGIPENRPPERGSAGGNGLIIDHGFGEYSALWHAVPGSLTVKVGDHVQTGQVVAQVGNSGRSTGPHIHWHVSYRPGGPQTEAFGLPADMVNVFVDDTWYAHKMPVRGQYVRSAPRPQLQISSVASSPRVFLAL